MGLEQYDSYAIKSYSFAVHKTSTFFSVTTLVLSIIIIAASLMLNINTLSHLWLPLQDLDVQSAQSLELPESLTSTLLCIKPQNPSQVGLFRFTRMDNSELFFRRVLEAQVKQTRPNLWAQIGGGFECVDLSGFNFASGSDMVQIQVVDTYATMYIKGSSLKEIMFGAYELAMEIPSPYNGQYYSLKSLTFLKCTLLDRLYLNYQPTIINTINSDAMAPQQNQLTFSSNNTIFAINIFYPVLYQTADALKYNLLTATITRKNIGIILGSVLSWISVMALAIGLVAGPLMDKKLSLLIAQTLFQIQESMLKVSFFRFIIACFKKDIFKSEDRFVKFCEKIQQMKDVASILKLQLLLARLSPKADKPYVDQPIVAEHSFNSVVRNDTAVHSFLPQSAQKVNFDSQNKVKGKIDLCPQTKPISPIVSLRQKLLYFLDNSSDPVSVSYEKGGIGSRSSLCLSIMVLIGFSYFLSKFGVLGEYVTLTNVSSKNQMNELLIPGFSLIFITLTNQTANLSLLDGNLSTIKRINIIQGQVCLKGLSELQKIYISPFGSNYFCFSDDIWLKRSQNPSQTIEFQIDNSVMAASTRTYLYVANQMEIPFYTPIVKIIQFVTIQIPVTYQELPINLIQVKTDQKTYSGFQLQVTTKYSNVFNRKNGVIMKLSGIINRKLLNSNTFYDVVQNVWSFALVCFTVLVMKITKYINLQQKQQRLSVQKTEYRDSICIMLSRIYGLRNGRHQKELQNLQFYTKQKIPTI